MAECALAIVAECSAMSLLAMAICARRTTSCVRSRWSCIVNPLQFAVEPQTALLQNRSVRGEGERLPNKRHRLANSGVPSRKKIFSGPCRNRGSRAVIGVRGRSALVAGTFALRVLRTLPQAHQGFVFHEICGLCHHYLRSKPEDASEISSEELVSEVWAKLIGSITMPDPNDVAERSNFPDPSD